MLEQCQIIGETAGKIYKTLEKNGSSVVETLPKEIGENDAALVNQAIGWLCREGKLNFERKGQVVRATLAASHANCCQ